MLRLRAPWRPEDALDWVVLALLATGLITGLRRGFVRALAGALVTLLALALAVHLGPRAAAYAVAHWNARAALAGFLARYLPLPDGSGQIPYSPSALALLLQQLQSQGDLTPAYAASLHGLLGTAGPAPPASTLDAYIDGLLAARLLALAAFTVVLSAALAVLGPLAGLFARRVPGGWAGVSNAALGALFGAAERLVHITVLLAVLAALSAMPVLAALATVTRDSRYAPVLLAVLRHAVPASDQWLQSWLLWV